MEGAGLLILVILVILKTSAHSIGRKGKQQSSVSDTEQHCHHSWPWHSHGPWHWHYGPALVP